ncbi:MAG: hypothetical protein ACP5HK_01685 [Acidilobus sp.]
MSGEERAETRITTNMLVLELSTMIVAIALAFNAQSLELSGINAYSLLDFVVTNVVVVWFWWRYVVERLSYPPRTSEFPLPDIVVLLLISMLPVVFRAGNLEYLAGVMAGIAFTWAAMLRDTLRDPKVSEEAKAELRQEAVARTSIGLFFAVSASLYSLSRPAAHVVFGVTVLLLAYRVFVGHVMRRHRRRLRRA